MGFNYRRNLAPEEKQAREEINRRAGAVRLAGTYIKNHLKVGGPQSDSNAAVFGEEVLRLGVAAEEVSTEMLDSILTRIEHQLSVAQSYTDSFEALYNFDAGTKYLRNEANERFLTRVYRQEWPHDTVMTPGKLIGLFRLQRVRDFVKPNAEYVVQQDADRQQAAAVSAQASASGNAIAAMTARYYVDGELRGRNDYERAQTKRLVDAEVAALLALPPQDLMARYDQLKEQQRMKGLTADQLRAEVRASESKRLAAYSRFEVLPDLYTPIGKTEGVEWTASMLRSLPSTTISQLLRTYGEQQLNAKIQQNATMGRK